VQDIRPVMLDDVQAGATFFHCDRTFVVTYAYGAYAMESPAGD
jgi:hypothetical protein